MPKFLLTIILLVASPAVYAQTWEIGLGGGGAGYMGDLNQHNPLKISGISVNGFLKYNFNGYLSVKGQLNYGEIAAADSNSSNANFRERNLSFYNKLKEASVVGEFNFMHYIPDAGKNLYTPFVYLGIGITAHAPRTIFRDAEVGLRGLTTEGPTNSYGENVVVIPFGAGIKYNIGGKFNLIGDIGYRYTFTDYLDDVSGVYAEPSQLKNDYVRAIADRSLNKTGIPGTQRGDFRKRDMYMFFNISLSYTFVTQRCYFENR